MSEQKIDPPELLQIPHQAIVSLNAVVNCMMPDGSWHPRSVFHDQFYLRLTGNSEREVKDSLIKQLDELKEKWSGQVGRLATTEDAQLSTSGLLSAQTIEPNSVISELLDSEERVGENE